MHNEFHDSSLARVMYAENEDGIHWVKPKLSLVEYRDSKKNITGLPNRF